MFEVDRLSKQNMNFLYSGISIFSLRDMMMSKSSKNQLPHEFALMIIKTMQLVQWLLSEWLRGGCGENKQLLQLFL